MKKTKWKVAVATSVMMMGSAQAEIISLSSTATAVSIAENSTITAGSTGGREVSYRTPLIHSTQGQSFTAAETAVAKGISIMLQTTETFSGYNASTFELRVFEGNGVAVRNTNPLGTYTYDATGLANNASEDWLRFDLGTGVAMTQGSQYSFLITFASELTVHNLQFTRDRDKNYAGGTDLRGGNAYDWANRVTDPWDDVAGATQSSVSAGTEDMFFSVDTIPEPATLGLVAMVGTGILFVRRRLML